MFNTRRNQELWNIQSGCYSSRMEMPNLLDNALPNWVSPYHLVPKEEGGLVLGLLCTVTQLYSLFLKFRSKEGGK